MKREGVANVVRERSWPSCSLGRCIRPSMHGGQSPLPCLSGGFAHSDNSLNHRSPNPKLRPIRRMPIPRRRSLRMWSSTALPTGVLPSFVPLALARASPALTRSRIISLSNSADTPIIWNSALPAGVVVSTAC